jgi:two-component sensor histidine kinase
VTELVINALKHGFPDGRRGRIVVQYSSQAEGWSLVVSDDGIGMPTGDEAPKAGLGTGIIEALAKNLDADIRMGSVGPGTAITVAHTRSTADVLPVAV